MPRHRVQVRVIYADTDAMGIVYHTNYIRWFEIGRTELLRDMGLSHARMEGEPFLLPLTRVYCHYLVPARIDQLLTLETEIAYLKRASVKFHYEIWDEQREVKMVEGYSVHACTDRNGQIVKLPEFCVRQVLHHEPQLKGEKHGG
ncbi:MAG: acyl-CoA thioesterase [Deltaproteobacteria bacterium HGW-Deltaproteobacteria-19]|jgi:acyl-CoA thioester hydrolase|nr:MAG: acyl-CoA thioesterase [Deltaproteobacteria bacterium HGW-Deltaproteobacteria-19]